MQTCHLQARSNRGLSIGGYAQFAIASPPIGGSQLTKKVTSPKFVESFWPGANVFQELNSPQLINKEERQDTFLPFGK